MAVETATCGGQGGLPVDLLSIVEENVSIVLSIVEDNHASSVLSAYSNCICQMKCPLGEEYQEVQAGSRSRCKNVVYKWGSFGS